MARGRSGTLTVAALCLGLLTAGAASANGWSSENRGFHLRVEWSAEGVESKGEGLFLYGFDDQSSRARMLVKTPSGRQLILTRDLHVQGSLDRVRLLDDETGWWLEVVRHYPLEAESLRPFLRKAMDLVEKEDAESIHVVVTTSDGFRAEADLPANEQPSALHDRFVAELERNRSSEKLRGYAPEGLGRDVEFLEAVLLDHGLDLRAPVEVLNGVLRPSPDSEAGADWRQQKSETKKGFAVITDGDLEFVSGFRSVKNSEPLEDAPVLGNGGAR